MYVSIQQSLGRSAPPRPRLVKTELRAPEKVDVVDTWGQDSFPASDPPSNW